MKEYKNVLIKVGNIKKMDPEIEEIFNNMASEGWEYCTKLSYAMFQLVVFEREK